MSWLNYFPNIKLINLKHRVDRLEDATRILNEYGIPFERVEAIHNESAPCIGLVDTMKQIFKESLEKGHQNVLIFEDDLKPLVAPGFFNSTMDCVVNELPDNWDFTFLGVNPSGGFSRWISNTILKLNFGYNTHAVAYNKKMMELIVSNDIKEPIDNWCVRMAMKNSNVYATFPNLFSQTPGYSDIGKSHTDWTNEIENRYREQIQILNQQ